MGYNGTPGDSSNGMIESVTAQNAKLTVNNVEIENSSNTISDSLEEDITAMTISKDTSENAVKAWVDANQIHRCRCGAESQDSSNGALLGDSTLRTIQTQLKTLLANTPSSSNYKTLAQIGITSDASTGKLEIATNCKRR